MTDSGPDVTDSGTNGNKSLTSRLLLYKRKTYKLFVEAN